MPHTKSAKKRVIQNIKRRNINRAIKSALTTHRRHFTAALSDGDIEKSEAALSVAQKVFAQAGAKGTLHKNTASRKISRMARKLVALKAAKA